MREFCSIFSHSEKEKMVIRQSEADGYLFVITSNWCVVFSLVLGVGCNIYTPLRIAAAYIPFYLRQNQKTRETIPSFSRLLKSKKTMRKLAWAIAFLSWIKRMERFNPYCGVACRLKVLSSHKQDTSSTLLCRDTKEYESNTSFFFSSFSFEEEVCKA